MDEVHEEGHWYSRSSEVTEKCNFELVFEREVSVSTLFIESYAGDMLTDRRTDR
jgi:hypothetical protein